MEKLNHVDYSIWSLKDIVEYVTTSESQVSFSSYACTYIEKIDKPRTAKNYALALRHLEKYSGKPKKAPDYSLVGRLEQIYH